MLYISSYRIIIHLLFVMSLKYGRSIQVYTHVCTARREGSSSPSEYPEISNRVHFR